MIQLAPFILAPLFIALALSFFAALGWFVYGVSKGRPALASAGPLIFWGASYTLLLAAGSATGRERRVPLGTQLCFDDWCVTVMSVHGADRSSSANRIVSADVRVSSDAKRVTMRGSNPCIYFIDDGGKWFPAQPAAGSPPMDRPVAPGEAYATRVQARVPAGARIVAVRVWEGGWIDRVVPFDEESPFHGKTFYSID